MECGNGAVDLARKLRQRLDALGIRCRAMCTQALDVPLGRTGGIGDFRHLRHCEGTVHRVDRTQDVFIRRERAAACAIKPLLDRGHVPTHFAGQDFQQDGVDRNRNHRCCRNSFQLRHFRGRHFRGRHLHGRPSHGLRGDFQRLRNRRGIDRFFAGGEAFGRCTDALQIQRRNRVLLQSRVQVRQLLDSGIDQANHGRRCRARAIQHAVEHVLDLPAVLAQCRGAYQAAAALQRVEHAADRAQAFVVPWLGFPRRHHCMQVLDLIVELFNEDFADFVVDVFLAKIEGIFRTQGKRT